MRIVGLIPSHLESKRLPRKALADICGLPMVVHVYKRAEMCRFLDEVYVCTDSTEILEAVERNGGQAVMSSCHHQTGSDRIAEVARHLDGDIFVNIQGDEALLNPDHITSILSPVMEEKVKVAFGITPYSRRKQASDIKAVCDLHGNIMYMSREDIPSNSRTPNARMFKVVFIVPFQADFLREYSLWAPTYLERIEYNEYLRILEHGITMRGVYVTGAHVSVDTPMDLEEVRRIMPSDPYFRYK